MHEDIADFKNGICNSQDGGFSCRTMNVRTTKKLFEQNHSSNCKDVNVSKHVQPPQLPPKPKFLKEKFASEKTTTTRVNCFDSTLDSACNGDTTNPSSSCSVKYAIERFNNLRQVYITSPPTSSYFLSPASTRSSSSSMYSPQSPNSESGFVEEGENAPDFKDAKPSSSEVVDEEAVSAGSSTDSELQTICSSEVADANTIKNGGSNSSECDLRKLSFCASTTLHTTILNEMRSKGLFKKISTVGIHLPEDIGKMREASGKKSRQPCSSAPLDVKKPEDMFATPNVRSTVCLRPNTTSTLDRNENNISLDSCHSASQFFPDVASISSFIDYACEDEKENKRLNDLHGIAREFYMVQRAFVELLHHIGENYPKYLTEFASRSGKLLFHTPNPESVHVIFRISKHFCQILGVHKMLLEDFAEKYAKWDSRTPDLAKVLMDKAEFLKICSSFLKEKRTLTAELIQALSENKDLAVATKQYEENVLNAKPTSTKSPIENGGSFNRGMSIVMQLDSVHQNVVRYRLLMERYRKNLVDGSPETQLADDTLRKLITVSNTVNGYLADADADKKLLQLHRKLEGVFDVFSPGRRLIHEGELQRQTRKDLQLRYLILFSDTLLICRYSSLGASDSFDLSRLYKIPIDRVRVQVEPHEDYDCEFAVISSKKSSAFVVKSRVERDTWVNRITEARREFCEKKMKRKYFVLKERANTNSSSAQDSCDISPDVGNGSSMVVMSEHDSLNVTTSSSVPSILSVSANPTVSVSSWASKRASVNSINQRNQSRYEALWIPDYKSTKCLMSGCDTKFSVLKRKHHCRQCGWLICGSCVGYAPVKIKNYERVKVCPECYYDIVNLFERGKLFSPTRVRRINASASTSSFNVESAATSVTDTPPSTSVNGSADGAAKAGDDETRLYSIDDSSLRVSYDGGLRQETPSALFSAPSNGSLKKLTISAQSNSDTFLVSGKVYWKNRKGIEVLRWARLTKEVFLQFYEAEFDTEPSESFFVYGYSIETADLDDGRIGIKLIHRNQFATDRKEHHVSFIVSNARSADRWLESLRNALDIPDEGDG